MDQHDLEAGVEIGDFRIERRIGAGGMGIVYRARQVSLDRTVALKVLGAALIREADRMRFQREARAVAKLHHPGIAAVYFIGQDRQVCYLAMEFIEGRSLREVIDRLAAAHDPALTIDLALGEAQPEDAGNREVRYDQPTADYVGEGNGPVAGAEDIPERPTPEAQRLCATRSFMARCCDIGIETALALGHAHERGVIHRDVKPENILLDRQGRVHLIDFGVARFFEDVSLTNTGALVGTPMYMSPEQVTGCLNIDHRTDIYSLGVVLYELLTLARPIAAPTREGVLRQIVTKATPPASWRNPALPRDLEGVLHNAMAKDPDERYQTAAELAADLRRWLDGKPVVAPLYRYRLDPREIKAERPAGILVLAFAHFLGFVCSAVAMSFMITMIILSYYPGTFTLAGPGQGEAVSPEEFRYYMATGIPWDVLSCAYFLGAGFGLLAAHRWARWTAIGVSSLIALWSLAEMGGGLIRGRLHPALGFHAALLLVAGSTVAYLWRRPVRHWFGLAARLRAEHRQAIGVPAGGKNPSRV
jgi:serine/threonine protein kinase